MAGNTKRPRSCIVGEGTGRKLTLPTLYIESKGIKEEIGK
jgi:hypothetical protein